jgi:hypothetical protein
VSIYDLLFILLFLGSVVAVTALLILTLTRRRRAARALFLSLTAIWGAYFVALVAWDALAVQQVTKEGDNLCFDEMCFAVVSTQVSDQTAPSSVATSRDGKVFAVTVRMTSRSLGRPQAEGGLRGRLYQDGRYFLVSDAEQHSFESIHGATPKLTQKLNPGQSILSVLVFKIPSEISHPALTLDHGFTPGYFIIGESPFLHKPPIMELATDHQ